MTNPQLQQMIQTVDQFLASYPTLCQYGASKLEITLIRSVSVLVYVWFLRETVAAVGGGGGDGLDSQCKCHFLRLMN
jgi:hypothetical protein